MKGVDSCENIELIMLSIIEEVDEEEEKMASNMRGGFHERQ